MNLKQRFAEKRYGFYVTLAVAVLAIITAIVYSVCYKHLAVYLSKPAVALLIVGAAVAIVLAMTKFDEFGAAILALFSLIAMLLFIKVIYEYVMIVVVGIDIKTFSPEFLATAVLLALTFVGSVVAVFLPKHKIKEEK